MLIPEERVGFCLAKAKEVTDCYILMHQTGGNHTLKSVELLIEAVKPILSGNLEIHELDEVWSAAPVRGFFTVDKDGNYKIVHLAGQRECWYRLVICKELFHALLDSEESRNICIASHLDEYMSSFPDTKEVPGNAVISEWQAELAAMEFLIPYKDRKFILNGNNDYSSNDVAHRYMVPKVMVERYLSSEYMDNLKEFYAD